MQALFNAKSPEKWTQSPRSQHLYRLWQALAREPSPPQVDRWLASYFREHKSFGKKDRHWYTEAVFAAFRFGNLILSSLSTSSQEVSASKAGSAWQALMQSPAEKVFGELELWQEQLGRHSAELRQNEKEAGFSSFSSLLERMNRNFENSLSRRQELSAWNSADLQTFLLKQLEPAPFWVRLNQPERKLETIIQLEAADCLPTEFGAAWRLKNKRNLQNLPCFEQGWLEVQDFASQQLGASLPVDPNSIVWDCCAGGGGKTVQLALRMNGSGLIVASDIRSYKLREVQRRATRIGLNNVHTLAWDGLQLPVFPKQVGKNNGFDAIFLDAPCSGSGTWRRNPEAQFRFDSEKIAALQKLQLQILKSAWTALKPGGLLLYGTCSWLPAENEDLVQAALQKLDSAVLERQELLGNPKEDSDTMYYALLRKLK